jgi:D-psicose/D-tagatose/L-ribulose 3-epimerase
MKIGLNLLAVGGFVTEEHRPIFETLRALGYDGVEIPVFEGDVRHYQSLGAILRDVGLEATTVTIVGEDTNPISPDPQIRRKARDRHRWAVDCTAALGGTVICGPYHSPLGIFSGHGPTDAETDCAAEVLRDMADYAQAAGVHLSIEAVNRFECYALTTLAQARALKAKVAHPNFAYMYDTFHANIEERDPVEAYRRHAHEITHIHVSENDRGIPGRGHVPWGASFRAFREAGYDGWITVEAFGRALPALAAATRVWRDLFDDHDTLYAESIGLIRREWQAAAPSPGVVQT